MILKKSLTELGGECAWPLPVYGGGREHDGGDIPGLPQAIDYRHGSKSDSGRRRPSGSQGKTDEQLCEQQG